jgi:hypothetical protein
MEAVEKVANVRGIPLGDVTPLTNAVNSRVPNQNHPIVEAYNGFQKISEELLKLGFAHQELNDRHAEAAAVLRRVV